MRNTTSFLVALSVMLQRAETLGVISSGTEAWEL
jgi:hypothetical protein